MRIVIDMQGLQSESRFRGIGRYTQSFVDELIRQKGNHEVILVLSGLLPKAIDQIRQQFSPLLPSANIVTWHAETGVSYRDGDAKRRERASKLRQEFLKSLCPDVIHVTSLFEGYLDDAVTNLGNLSENYCVSTMMYDLIPLLNPEHYLKSNPTFSSFYYDKLADLSKASCLLAISDFARAEAIEQTSISPSIIHNISTAVDLRFKPIGINDAERETLLSSYQINRPFFFYSGGSDERKNLPALVRAYAGLNKSYREKFQLVLSGHMAEVNVNELKNIARKSGIKTSDLIFTGYLSDEDLIKFYNCAYLFVFPSWHEGFGLPALEAMSCGTPVIGADNSSLLEVIGDQRFMFNPFDVSQIQSRMVQFIEDSELRQSAINSGLKRAKLFSWEKTAQRALNAWMELSRSNPNHARLSLRQEYLLSDLAQTIDKDDQITKAITSSCIAQNQLSGRERQLLIDVSEISQRDAATGVQRVVRSYLKCLLDSPPPDFSIELVYASNSEGYRYARRYQAKLEGSQFDNVELETHIYWTRGDIFFALDMQHDVQLRHAEFFKKLMDEGVNVIFLVHDLLPIQYPDLFEAPFLSQLHREWLTLIAQMQGAICVSNATAVALNNWLKQEKIKTSSGFMVDWVHNGGDVAASLPSRGLPKDADTVLPILRMRPTFLSVGTLEPRKSQEQILKASELLWSKNIDFNLVFVGHTGWKYEEFTNYILGHSELNKRLFWLKGISDEYLELVYKESSCLIAASLDEGFGLPVVEAAKYHLPIIARDIPVFREVAGSQAKYFYGNKAEDLSNAMWDWLENHKEDPRTESEIPWSTWNQSTEKLKIKLTSQFYVSRQMLVDISELVRVDAKTGIQRVVRSILKEWISNPPNGYRVEPVYIDKDGRYRYARHFLRSWLNDQGISTDEPIEMSAGDIFYGLDYQPVLQAQQSEFYKYLRQQGVRTYFLVYDLLPIEMPDCFPDGYDVVFRQWLEVVAQGTGIACISKATADAFRQWAERSVKSLSPEFKIGVCHIGADLENSEPSRGLPDNSSELLSKFSQRPTFLIVGTVEPRKGHLQTILAFEELWKQGRDLNLVIVGKPGWLVESLEARIHADAEYEHRLFWLKSATDEFLEKIYDSSACVIVASRGEGFGLPLIEAAHRKLPIIARNLDVFREIGGDYPVYFNGDTPEELARVIDLWLTEGIKADTDKKKVKVLTWKESAESMASFLLSESRDL